MIRLQDLSNGSPGEDSGRTAGRPLFPVFPKWPTFSIQEIIPVFLTLLIPKRIGKLNNMSYYILIIHNNHQFLLHQQKNTPQHIRSSDVLTPSGAGSTKIEAWTEEGIACRQLSALQDTATHPCVARSLDPPRASGVVGIEGHKLYVCVCEYM